MIDIKGDSMFRTYPDGDGTPERKKFVVFHSDDRNLTDYGTGFYLMYPGDIARTIVRIDSNSFVLLYTGDIGGNPYIRVK